MPANRVGRTSMSLLLTSVLVLLLAAAMYNLTAYIYPGDFSVAAMSTGFSVYWVGLPAIITGLLGITTVRLKHSKCVIISHMAAAIFTSVTAFAACGMFAVYIAASRCYNSKRHCFSALNSYDVNINFLFAVLAVQVGVCVTSIISSVLSSRLLNSGSRNSPPDSPPSYHDNMGMITLPPYPHDQITRGLPGPQYPLELIPGYTAGLSTGPMAGVPDTAPPPYYPREQEPVNEGEIPGMAVDEVTASSDSSSQSENTEEKASHVPSCSSNSNVQEVLSCSASGQHIEHMNSSDNIISCVESNSIHTKL